MNKEDLLEILAAVKELAIAAGEKILENTPTGQNVDYKIDGSPVSKADLASHEVIFAGLAELDHTIPIISEESDINIHHLRDSGAELFWLVDPLDGTKDFIKGLSEYTVNIALISKDTPIMGVVYLPARDHLYFATQATGAWKREGSGSVIQINTKQSLKGTSLTAAVSRSHSSVETVEFLASYGITEVIKSGSSVKICLVAEGKADLYPRLGPTSLWDTAAGVAIAREAGCRVVDLNGYELSYDLHSGILHHGFLVYSPFTFKPNLAG